jgi:hypothetical protein
MVVHYTGWAAIRELQSRGPLGRNLLSSERPLSDEEKDLVQEVARFATANPDDPHIALAAQYAAPFGAHMQAVNEGVPGLESFFLLVVAGKASMGYKDVGGHRARGAHRLRALVRRP